MTVRAEVGLRAFVQVPDSGTARVEFPQPADATPVHKSASHPAAPSPTDTVDPNLIVFAARFGLPVARADTFRLTEADALDLVEKVARARIPPVRIGRTEAGPLVALALENAREIAPATLRALVRGAAGRLVLTNEADLRQAVAQRIATIAPQTLLGAARRCARTSAHRTDQAKRIGSLGSLGAADSEAMAAWLGLPFASQLAPDDGGAFAELVAEMPDRLCAVRGSDGPLLALAPELGQLPSLAAAACQRTPAARALVFTNTAAFRQARRPSAAPAPTAIRWDLGLPKALSACSVLSPTQRLLAPPAVATATVAAVSAPALMPLAASLFTGLVLLALAVVRGVASLVRSADQPRPLHPLGDDALPTYTVLVPLYGEASSVAPLIRSVGALDYPKDRIEVLYLLEADDPETRAAFEAVPLPPGHRVVVVPPDGPRTKPKALNVGLALATGALVTIYDAEDRPEPGQLRLAAETFSAGSERLACLQARLAIDHARDTWITRMFAIEYACLFDVLLPWLAARGLFFPLGGTSNHFRGFMYQRHQGFA